MSSNPKGQYYVLPAKVVHAGAIALLLSALLNGLGTLLYVKLTAATGESVPYFFSDNKTPAKLPLEPRTVALEVVDSERYGMHDDNDWASVTPLGHGFVKIGADEDFFAVSMYHQLHCLNGFRKMLSGEHRNASRHEHDEMHNLHCLTYMRQMILCSGDTTLEPAFFAQNTDGRKTQAAYGVGVTHQCKDWVQIRDFAEDNFKGWKDETSGFASSEIDVVQS